jgi:hypothetical protein
MLHKSHHACRRHALRHTEPSYTHRTSKPRKLARYVFSSSSADLHVLTLALLGGLGGPPIGGLILSGSHRNWHVLAGYSGLIQGAGVVCILYGECMRSCSADDLLNAFASSI